MALKQVRVPPAPLAADDKANRRGLEAFRQMIIKNLAKWARENIIESQELVREMFALLLRQYNGVREVKRTHGPIKSCKLRPVCWCNYCNIFSNFIAHGSHGADLCHP